MRQIWTSATRLPTSISGPKSWNSVEHLATSRALSDTEQDEDLSEPISKRRRITTNDTEFDPSTFAAVKEGTFAPHPFVAKY